MLVESAVETYLCTCARCAARWMESYEVNQVTDDAGAVSSFYRHRGVPCESPTAAGNVACPTCGSTRVRKDPRFDEALASAQAGLAGPVPHGVRELGAEPIPAIPRQRGVAGTWHRFKFSAVVSMDAGGHRHYASGAPGLMVLASSLRRPAVRQYFPAVVFTDDGRPLKPGDHGIESTICVPDDDAAAFFQSGQHFVLWDGTEVGHGTVAQHLVFGWPELS